MTYSDDHHAHDPEVREPGSGLVGYAAIKYTAIVIIVGLLIGPGGVSIFK